MNRASRALVCGCGAFCAAIAVGAPAFALEVPNADVEVASQVDPAVPTGWTTNAWGDFADGATFAWKDGGYNSTMCLRVQTTAPAKASGQGDAKWRSAPINVKGVGAVKVGDHYRSDRASRLLVGFYGPNDKTAYVELAAAASSTTWTAASGTATVPSWADTMRIMHVIEAPGWLETDAYTIAVPDPKDVPVPPAGSIAKVSVTFDDGWISAYNLLIPAMDERGLKATHFIVSDFLDRPGFGADYIGSEQLLDLANRGHEIASHSRMHIDQTTLHGAALNDDLAGSKANLQALHHQIVGFAPPFGQYNAEVSAAAAKHYTYLRTVKAGLNEKPYKTEELWGVVVHDKMQLDEFAKWVIDAAKTGHWVIFIYHRAAKEPPADSYVRPSAFEQQMDYLLRAKADVRPLGEVLGAWKWQKIIIEKPDIVTGKQLPLPAAAGKRTGYEEPTAISNGCIAGLGAGGFGAAFLLSFGLFCAGIGALWARRS